MPDGLLDLWTLVVGRDDNRQPYLLARRRSGNARARDSRGDGLYQEDEGRDQQNARQYHGQHIEGDHDRTRFEGVDEGFRFRLSTCKALHAP